VVVEVSGPGVDGVRELGIDGLGPGVLEALAEVNDAFPTGVDTWLLSDAGQVAGLPRSARLRIRRIRRQGD
jgi:alpha-D-ribose 1-methylphosphonate 5-triphosphate synthase subunit PhnH